MPNRIGGFFQRKQPKIQRMSLRVNYDLRTGEYETGGLLFEFSFCAKTEHEEISTDRGLLVVDSGFNQINIDRVTNPNGDEVVGDFDEAKKEIESLIN